MNKKHNTTTLSPVILPHYPGLVQKLFSMFFYLFPQKNIQTKDTESVGPYLYRRPSLHSSSILKTVSLKSFNKY